MNIKTIARVGLLSAVAVAVYLIRIPFPPAPFLTFDISTVPALYAGFALNPLMAALVVLLKGVITSPSSFAHTGIIGVLASLVISLSYVLPATLLYHYRRAWKTAIVSLIASVVVAIAVALLCNYFIFLPLFMPGITHDARIGYLLTAILPFNLINYALCSAVTLFTYKPLRKFLKL